jgi:riboflavin synthase
LFTGLIEGTGKILTNTGNKLLVEFCAAQAGSTSGDSSVNVGDSISVNGACLTATDVSGKKIGFDVSHESLGVTNIADLSVGENVNIEKAMSASGRFHGHFVTGHIDTVGKISKIAKRGGYIDITIEMITSQAQCKQWLVSKGSIAINGVSLTVNEVVGDNSFRLTLIPHTLKMTNLLDIRTGDRVNVEFDILAKYVQNMVNGRPEKPEAKGSGVTEQMLREHGYVR